MSDAMPLDPRTEYDYAQRQLHSAKEMGILPDMSRQEVAFVTYVRQGLPYTTAARCAGMTAQHLSVFIEDERFTLAMQYTMERASATINITRDMLNYMLLESHSLASNATEQIMAIKELGKLNGLYPSATGAGRLIEVEKGVPASGRALQNMSDEQLLEHAGFDSLDPVPVSRGGITDV